MGGPSAMVQCAACDRPILDRFLLMSWTEHGMRNVYSVRTVKPPSPTNVFQGTANYFVETTFLDDLEQNVPVVHKEYPQMIWSGAQETKFSI